LSRTNGTAEPGETVIFSHTVTNTGTIADSYELTLAGDWADSVVPASLNLDVGESAPVTVTVIVPPTAEPPTQNVTTVTVSSDSSDAEDSATDTVLVGTQEDRGLLLTPETDGASGMPGELVVYEHTLLNSGTVVETVELSGLSDNGWLVTVTPENVMLAAGEETAVSVAVQIPNDATLGTVDVTTVTAASSDGVVEATAVDTTTVGQIVGVEIFPAWELTGTAGSSVVFTHTVRNTGTDSDTFTIGGQSSRNWPLTLPDPVTIPAGGETTIFVELLLPAAAGGLSDVITVTATSALDPAVMADVVNRVTVEGPTGDIGVSITPDNSDTGDPGTTVFYNHIVENTGNIAETFAFTLQSSQGWAVDAEFDYLTIPAGQSSPIQVAVTVPGSVAAGTVDVTTITARSLSDATIFDTATNTTTAGEQKLYLPIIVRAQPIDPPGPTPTPDPGIPTPTPTPVPGTPTPTATPMGCPTGIDLVVLSIIVEPASPIGGQPAMVHVTIMNQGTNNVPFGNNFYLDFYVDRIPQPLLVGDITWGVQGRLLTVGTPVTFSSPYTFNSGTRQLYAQVDTDNTVQECGNEDNNVLGPVIINVSGQFQEATPPPVRILPEPRSTPTPEGFEQEVQPIPPGDETERLLPLVTPSPTLTPRPEG
jgi:uncharacterized membrane protein